MVRIVSCRLRKAALAFTLARAKTDRLERAVCDVGRGQRLLVHAAGLLNEHTEFFDIRERLADRSPSDPNPLVTGPQDVETSLDGDARAPGCNERLVRGDGKR